jgi:hypothetical protein
VLERAANAGSKSARPEPAARSTRARGHTSAGGVTRRRAAPERARKPRPA